MAYVITLRNSASAISQSSKLKYPQQAYELFKESMYERKRINWNTGSKENPNFITTTINNTRNNLKAIETWLEEGENFYYIVRELSVDTPKGSIRLGDLLKDQIKSGPKFNKGNVSEGILAAAIAARFTKKLGDVKPEHVHQILAKTKIDGKYITGHYKGANWPQYKGEDDHVELSINLPVLDKQCLMNPKIIKGLVFKDLVKSSCFYANARDVTAHAKEVYENNKTDHILVDSDGVGNMTESKIDLAVKFNGEKTKLNISLKAGTVKQFGQVGGATVEAINKTFAPMNIQLDKGDETKFNKALSENNVGLAMKEAYEAIQNKIDMQLHSGDGSKFFGNVGSFVRYHATYDEEGVELLALDRGEATLLEFGSTQQKLAGLGFVTTMTKSPNKLLKQFKYKVDDAYTIAVATSLSNDPARRYFVRIRQKPEIRESKKRGKYIYYRNIVEKGNEMSTYLQRDVQ